MDAKVLIDTGPASTRPLTSSGDRTASPRGYGGRRQQPIFGDLRGSRRSEPASWQVRTPSPLRRLRCVPPYELDGSALKAR